MGTRLWYAMWDANEDDDAAFERRANPVLREIGDRCKVVVAEAGQQRHQPAPRPAPTRQVAQPQTPSVGAPHGSTSSSHSNQQREKTAQEGAPAVATVLQRTPSTASSMTSVSFAEMAAFIREERAFRESQRQEWEAKLETQRKESDAKLETQRKESDAKLKTERQEWEAKLESQRQEWEAKLETQLQEREATLQKAWTAKLKPQRSRTDASDARVLQARFEALHTSKLLSDDELYILENLVFDNVQDSERGEEGESHSTVGSLVRLCELATSDAGLARQLRRKYI